MLNRLYGLCGALAALSIVAIFLLMMAQSVLRIADRQIRGADDLTAWLCAAAAFLGLAATFRNGEHVRVGMWLEGRSARLRRLVEIACLSAALIFVGYVGWAGLRYIWGSYQMRELAQGLLPIPVWIPQLSFVLGISVFWLGIAEQLLKVIRGHKPDYQQAQEDRAARGEFDSV